MVEKFAVLHNEASLANRSSGATYLSPFTQSHSEIENMSQYVTIRADCDNDMWNTHVNPCNMIFTSFCR